jgi:tungstate transport system substrate-binding protein
MRSAHRLVTAFAIVTAAPLAAQTGPAPRDVILATTTSLQETGLLDTLVPLFRRATGYRLRAIAVGSGQALRMGERGDADVVLAHSPAAESAFVAAGHGTRRRMVASNYFTIVGPPGDPARVRGAADAAAALRRIAEAGAVFVSRGDSSGTHAREQLLWRRDGPRPRWSGYLETGQGMSATLLVADERRGYALTDRASFAALRHRLDLVPLREREPALRNVYHVLEVNAAGRARMNAAGGRALADFLVSDEAQDLLETFGRNRFGAPLFVPARGAGPSP